MTVSKLVNFNGKMILTAGRVVRRLGKVYVVDFSWDGIEFSGLWKVSECSEPRYTDQSR